MLHWSFGPVLLIAVILLGCYLVVWKYFLRHRKSESQEQPTAAPKQPAPAGQSAPAAQPKPRKHSTWNAFGEYFQPGQIVKTIILIIIFAVVLWMIFVENHLGHKFADLIDYVKTTFPR
jgi:hypothetical protein